MNHNYSALLSRKKIQSLFILDVEIIRPNKICSKFQAEISQFNDHIIGDYILDIQIRRIPTVTVTVSETKEW